MIKSLKLINFRNFSEKIIENFTDINFIVWENWNWKTNTLEAISLLCNNSILGISLDDLVKIWEDFFFIEIFEEKVWKIWFYYSKIDRKKNFLINNKKVTKKIFLQNINRAVIFSPIIMNMLYLWPTLRRDFLDTTLKSSFSDYEDLLKNYKKILKSRNSFLKAILEWKASKNDMKFWDEKFIEISEKIYNYRFNFINFLSSSIKNIESYFSVNIENISFEYITKVSEKSIYFDIKNYLEKNLDRDIILWKTAIWPHIDDFDIKINDISISKFGSRWEIKSVIIYLKLLEWIFIEKKTGQKPILIIDDFLSELDENHKDTLLEKIKYYQSFISNILKDEKYYYIKI